MRLLNLLTTGLSFFLALCTTCFASPDLSEFWFDPTNTGIISIGKVVSKQEAEHGAGAQKVQVTVQSFDLTANPIKFKVQFKRGNDTYPWEKTLPKEAPKFDGLPKYKEDQLLNDFVANLEKMRIKGDRQYVVEGDVDNLGAVKLVFRLQHVIRLFAFSNGQKWKVEDHKDSQKSSIQVQFGYDGDIDQDPKEPKEIHSLNHAEKNDLLDGYWFLNTQHRLQAVRKLTRSRVPADKQKWAEANGIGQMTYQVLKPGMENGQCPALVLDPPASYDNLGLHPSAKKNKYFRRANTLQGAHGQFIFFDLGRAYQTNNQEWRCYEQTVTDNGTTVTFADTNPAWFNRLAVVQATKTILPSAKLDSGPLGGPQFIPKQMFAEDRFFNLHETQGIPSGFRQIWKEHSTTGASTVSINIVDVKENGQWKNLSAFNNIVPAIVNGRLTMDITPNMHEFSNNSWQDAMNYLLIAYWLEGMEPVLKCTFPTNFTSEQNLAISKQISSILNTANCIQEDFSTAIFLVKDRQDMWSARPNDSTFNDRDKNDGSVWHYVPFWQTLALLMKEQGVKVLDFRKWANPNLKHISDHVIGADKFETIYLTEFARDKAAGLKLSDEEMLKMLAKTRGLEELKLVGIKGSDKVDLTQILAQNASTLRHLDLTGAEFPKAKEEDFVKLVSGMINLESLKLIGFYLSNGNTEALAMEIRNHKKLKEVHLALPYWPNTGVEALAGIADRIMVKPWNEGGFVNRSKAVLIGIPAVVINSWWVLPVMSGAEVIGDTPGNFACRDVLCYLSHNGTLEKLRLKVKGLINQEDCIRRVFKAFREHHELASHQVAIEFAK